MRNIILTLAICGLLLSSHFLANFSIDAKATEIDFANPLINAVDRGNIEKVEQYLNGGGNINKRGKFESTALMRAAYQGNSEIGKILLAGGAMINAPDLGGATALHVASREGYADFVKLLIDNEANVNVRDGEGWSPVLRAASRGNNDILPLLLEGGAEVNSINFLGETALIHSVKKSDIEAVKILLSYGANPELANNSGKTAIDIALNKGNIKISELLYKSKKDTIYDAVKTVANTTDNSYKLDKIRKKATDEADAIVTEAKSKAAEEVRIARHELEKLRNEVSELEKERLKAEKEVEEAEVAVEHKKAEIKIRKAAEKVALLKIENEAEIAKIAMEKVAIEKEAEKKRQEIAKKQEEEKLKKLAEIKAKKEGELAKIAKEREKAEKEVEKSKAETIRLKMEKEAAIARLNAEEIEAKIKAEDIAVQLESEKRIITKELTQLSVKEEVEAPILEVVEAPINTTVTADAERELQLKRNKIAREIIRKRTEQINKEFGGVVIEVDIDEEESEEFEILGDNTTNDPDIINDNAINEPDNLVDKANNEKNEEEKISWWKKLANKILPNNSDDENSGISNSEGLENSAKEEEIEVKDFAWLTEEDLTKAIKLEHADEIQKIEGEFLEKKHLEMEEFEKIEKEAEADKLLKIKVIDEISEKNKIINEKISEINKEEADTKLRQELINNEIETYEKIQEQKIENLPTEPNEDDLSKVNKTRDDKELATVENRVKVASLKVQELKNKMMTIKEAIKAAEGRVEVAEIYNNNYELADDNISSVDVPASYLAKIAPASGGNIYESAIETAEDNVDQIKELTSPQMLLSIAVHRVLGGGNITPLNESVNNKNLSKEEKQSLARSIIMKKAEEVERKLVEGDLSSDLSKISPSTISNGNGAYWLSVGEFADKDSAIEHIKSIKSENTLPDLEYKTMNTAISGSDSVSIKIGPVKTLKEITQLCLMFRNKHLGCSTINMNN